MLAICEDGFCLNGGTCFLPNIECKCPPERGGSQCDTGKVVYFTKRLIMKQCISCQPYALLGSAIMKAIVLFLTQAVHVPVTGKAHRAKQV